MAIIDKSSDLATFYDADGQSSTLPDPAGLADGYRWVRESTTDPQFNGVYEILDEVWIPVRIESTDGEHTHFTFDHTIDAITYQHRVNGSSSSDSFSEDSTTGPSSWTLVTKGNISTITSNRGVWNITTTGPNHEFDYHKAITTGNAAAKRLSLFNVAWEQNELRNDIDFYWSAHRNLAGAPDPAFYIRLHVNYDSAANQWQWRGQMWDGTNARETAWYNLIAPLPQPAFLVLDYNTNNNRFEAQIGHDPNHRLQLARRFQV